MRRGAIILLLVACACRERTNGYALIGDPQRGRAVVDRYGCASCHIIPGIAGQGQVGPTLAHIGRRAYLAGHLPNVPQNLIVWIRDPQSIKTQNDMPNLGVTARDARDIAAFLYTLQ